MLISRKLVTIYLLTLIIAIIGVSLVAAQNSENEDCATLVQTALTTVAEMCLDVEADSICYGFDRIKADVTAGTFAKPGDIIPLADFNTLETSRGNPERDRWGIAVINVADALRIYVLGGIAFDNASDDSGTAFTFATDIEKSDCNGTTSKLLLQSSADTTINLNNTEIALTDGSLAVLDAAADSEMNLMVVKGSAEVTAVESTERVTAGLMTSVELDSENRLMPASKPAPPQAYEARLVQFLPFRFVSDVIEIPAVDRWTGTGVELEAGQSYMVIAGELVKTIDYMPWSAPEGHSTSDCAAAGRGDWDCKCRTLPEWGQCTLDEVASMRMMGRVGEDGETFIVGAGGFFAAKTAGELFLGPNDNTFTDNVGAYYAVVIVNSLETSATPDE